MKLKDVFKAPEPVKAPPKVRVKKQVAAQTFIKKKKMKEKIV